jgi:5-formyltetrahydrofolate cyclo-ligase
MAPTWRYWRQRIFRETTHGGSANILSKVTALMTDKIGMRRKFRLRRNEFVLGLNPREKSLAFSSAPTPLKSILKPGRTVAAYFAIGSEANPMPILDYALSVGCKTALPHVTSLSSPMQFLSWSPGEALEQGPFNLLQPCSANLAIVPDIILAPLVAFDRSLSRLGQGAGHYDRALSLLSDVIVIGIGWSVQETDYLIVDPWDIPMDAVLTEKEWICA